eukprot:CAMPEP_0201729288 /NCGR_PEP_ID=MMETSP0593-20130828/18598_1 /ASSEMBLY_ACC=CAM_ASM_000672 /TAXON_ID=267983 /ORGANISM="Skeletonema japonicum, Strain CCMP2506" /LENGTH=83 /DNA_ID=CAMNT_0048221613 /DNA_START=159 /DNA_END=410 /DNA_ORIENTATION=+
MNTNKPDNPIYGTTYNAKKAPSHPIVIYIVIDNHLGINSGPNRAVSIIPIIAKSHATPKKDHPITEPLRKTRQNGVNVPAING